MLAKQVIKVPVRTLVKAQEGLRIPKDEKGNNIFKNTPPGYEFNPG